MGAAHTYIRNMTSAVPKLVCIAGPCRGRLFQLGEGEFTLGRGAGNHLSLVEPGASESHCRIVREGPALRLEDLESQTGTFLNGVPTRVRGLAHGDQIKIGESVFVVLLREDESPPALTVIQTDQNAWVTRRSTSYPVEGSPRAEASGGTPGDSGRTFRELVALLKITSVLGSVKRLDELEQKLIETILEVIPAERGAVLLVGQSIDQFTSIFGWDRTPEQHYPVEVSRIAIDRALRERVAVLSSDEKILADMADSPALEATSPARTLLVVPLVVFDRTVGAIYLDSADPLVKFDQGHVEWLKAFGWVAAVALEKARRTEWLENENRRLRDELDIDHSLVGDGPRMQEVYRFIAKVAPSPSTVLIRGESGTGKELLARAIHRNSPRADKPFVAINCAALPESLLESEMFGHQKGAFTGAVSERKGKVEVADGGTLFLDEVGELAPNLQAKLLRVLQEREFEPIGSTRPIKVDIRVVAASNKDLENAVRDGSFRRDLFYRLKVIAVTMPPLRERREDIPLLANYFVAQYSERSKRPMMVISEEALAYLTRYDWPGNVRELENAMERAVVLGTGDVIEPEHLPEEFLDVEVPGRKPLPQYQERVRETKRDVILAALKQARGNYTEAARALGLHPNYLHRLIRNMNLRDVVREQSSSS